MENKENIRIERTNEFEKQRREDMLKGKYAKLEIIISSEQRCTPFISLNLHNVSNKDVAYLYKTIQSTLRDIEKEYPLAVYYANLFLSEKSSEIRSFENLENEEDK